MSGYTLSPRALRDLQRISDYVNSNNRTAARRLLAGFRTTFEMLAATPGAGRRRDELAPAVRGFPSRGYVILYRETDDTVEILRVLHGSQDIERAFNT